MKTILKTIALLTSVMTLLKLTGDINISWAFALSPIWMPLTGIAGLVVFSMSMSFLINRKPIKPNNKK